MSTCFKSNKNLERKDSIRFACLVLTEFTLFFFFFIIFHPLYSSFLDVAITFFSLSIPFISVLPSLIYTFFHNIINSISTSSRENQKKSARTHTEFKPPRNSLNYMFCDSLQSIFYLNQFFRKDFDSETKYMPVFILSFIFVLFCFSLTFC